MTFDELGITPVKAGRYSTQCPKCSDTRKPENRKKTCLTVNNEEGNKWWNCSHCQWSGNLAVYEKYDKVREKARMPLNRPSLFSKPISDFLASKQISPETALLCGCYERDGFGGNKELCFPYYMGHTVVNVMFRIMQEGAKKVYQIKKEDGAKACFWGLEMLSLETLNEITIVEGQTDRMTFVQCDRKNILSVPMGSPNTDSTNLDKRLEFVRDEYIVKLFEKVDKFYLFLDNDPNGKFFRDALANELGKDRCWITNFPTGYKDANEIYAGDSKKDLPPLNKSGIDKLYESAYPFPLKGIVTISSIRHEIMSVDPADAKGLLSGYSQMDRLWSMRKNTLAVLSGIPGSGKSAVWRSHMISVIKNNKNIELAGYTPESRPMKREYRKLAEVVAGQRWDSSWHNGMSDDKKTTMLDFVEKHITLIDPDVNNFETFSRKAADKSQPFNPKGLRSILNYMLYLKKSKGIFGFWIDAWNKLDHQRDMRKPIEEFISQELDFLLEFLNKHDLFCLLVAHPTKMETQRGGNFKKPSLYDIKGSSAWNEKADIGLIASRKMFTKTNRKDEDDEDIWELNKNAPTLFECVKMKFDELGEVGETKMWLDRKNGDRFVFEDPNKDATYEAKKEKSKKKHVITSSVADEEDDSIIPTDDVPF